MIRFLRDFLSFAFHVFGFLILASLALIAALLPKR
jgi:hypothetical protein